MSKLPISDELHAKWVALASGSSFYDARVSDLDREDLLALIGFMQEEIKHATERVKSAAYLQGQLDENAKQRRTLCGLFSR